MPIQRTLSPVPPLGKKSVEPMKLDYLSTGMNGNPTTPSMITPPSSSRSRHGKMFGTDSEMSGVITNFNDLLLTDDTDDDDDDDRSCNMSSPQPTSIQPTEHKILSDKGMLLPEPLLTPNPHRFVLFPIQDSEVSPFDVKVLFNVINIKPNSK
jgi:hypothetical protein